MRAHIVGVENGIEFSVTDVGEFGVELVFRHFIPRQLFVKANKEKEERGYFALLWKWYIG